MEKPTSHNSKTVPYGAILPKSARFEDIDGEELFSCCYVCGWKISEVKDVSNFNESMEILECSKHYLTKEQKYL